MNIKKYLFFPVAALVACSTVLLSAMPAIAAQDSPAGISAQVTLADNGTHLPALLPPLTPKAHPPTYDNSYPPRPPRPRPPTPTYPQPKWPYNGYNGYNNWPGGYSGVSPDYYSPPVIVYQQPQTVQYAPVINAFSANPSYIQAGQTATLTWTVSNADTVTVSPSVGSVANSGSFTVTPAYTTTYTLVAVNNQGTVSASTTVTVEAYVASAYYGSGSSYAGSAPGTDASPIITSGIGPGNGTTANNSLMYLLLSLLALAAVVIVLLMVRKPAAAPARVQAGPSTGYLATVAAPAATVPVTGLTGVTSMEAALPAKLVSRGGTTMPVTGRPLGRRDFQAMAPAEKADLISRQHMLVTYENSQYRIEDLNSTNGTRLNGSEIRGSGKHIIENGDSIEIANALFLTFKV